MRMRFEKQRRFWSSIQCEMYACVSFHIKRNETYHIFYRNNTAYMLTIEYPKDVVTLANCFSII